MKKIKIIFTGGGSGGHTMPAFSMIQTLQKHCEKNNIQLNIIYIGSHNGIEKTIAEKNNIEYKNINTGKLRRYFSLKNISDIFNILSGFFQSKKIIKDFKPDILISTGGFVSVPPVIAAKQKRIPVIIHEQTIDAGLANKIAGKFADKIALTFEESSKYFDPKKIVITGLPLRNIIFSGTNESAKKRFNFKRNMPVLYFTGGGLGCHILNQTAINILNKLLDKCYVIFQTGQAVNNNDYEEMKSFRETLNSNKKNRFILFDFVHEEIGDIFAITDLAIARSGAGTVNEFLTLNIPAIYIPLSIATNNEQYKNAQIPVNLGGAVIIEEKDLDEKSLFDTIIDILFSEKIKKMKNTLKKSDDKNGNQNMLELILSSLKQKN